MPDEQSLETQSVDAMQLYQPLVQGWKALLKSQFAAFRSMAVNSQAAQGTFIDRLEALIQSANLPKSIAGTLTESIALLKSSYPQAVDLVNRAYPLVGEDIQSWFIDQLPDDFFILASQKLMEKIRGFDPMKEFDFVRNFSAEVQKSIKVTALRDFAKELTEKYYSFVSRDIKSLVRMGVPVLELGGQATQGEQLAAFAQKAGLVFQKGMQLFGDDIRDHDFRKVLAKLKEDVEPMSAIELDEILAEDDANHGPLTQLGIDRSAIDLVPVKAGTVAQVHIATVKEVVAIPANFGVKHEMITKKYAVKIMRPHLRESIDREFDMLEKSTQSEAIRGVLKDLKSSILGELDFSEEMNKSVVADNIYTANLSGGEKIKAAKAVAYSPHIMVQEFAEGKTIPSYYQDDFKQWSDAEKADFLHSTSKVLCRQLKDWISVAFNGHAKIPNGDGFIEGDRHCGNQLYDHKARTLTLIDFGAGTYISRKEREAIERFSIGVVAMRPKMIRRAFAFFLPEIHAKTPEGKQLRDRLDATFSDVVKTARTQEKINDLIEIFSDPEFEFKLDAELTSSVDLKKYVSDVLNRLSQAEKKALMNPRAVQQAQETLVRLFPTLKGNVTLERAIDKTITQTYRRAFRLEQGRWFINDNNQVLLMNTNKKIMDALFDNGLKAPQVLVQLHRGSKFIEDQIRLNNEQKALLQYELTQSNQLTHELKAKLKQDNIGNLYVLAVAKGKLALLFRSILSMDLYPKSLESRGGGKRENPHEHRSTM